MQNIIHFIMRMLLIFTDLYNCHARNIFTVLGENFKQKLKICEFVGVKLSMDHE